tara:strand:- start:209 stop:499 length:291 start_codon:yes stop_codon:yes gene_type:complete
MKIARGIFLNPDLETTIGSVKLAYAMAVVYPKKKEYSTLLKYCFQKITILVGALKKDTIKLFGVTETATIKAILNSVIQGHKKVLKAYLVKIKFSK